MKNTMLLLPIAALIAACNTPAPTTPTTPAADKNEDWVNIWSRERRYPKSHGKADTVLMQENWKVKDGKVVAFDQYLARQ